jgi:outer membrane murein-binding lipoprotein Lpp
VKTKILLVVLSVFVLTGCATMQRNRTAAGSDTLQTKVANLEEQVAARDQQIQDLQSEIERLSDRVSNQSSRNDNVSYHRVEYVPLPDSSYSGKTSSKDGEIIRVPVSVEQVQKALKAAGNYGGKIDGKLGDQTKSGIREFQTAHNLKSDGIVGKSTWAALKTYIE